MEAFNVDLPPVPELVGLSEEDLRIELEDYQRRLNISLEEMFTRVYKRAGTDFGFHDRGDGAAYDYDVGDLTTNGAWHDLDLSSIVEVGAKAVFILGHLNGGGVDWAIKFRENGNTNEVNHGGMETIRANVTRHRSSIVKLDGSRVIEYNADDEAWTTLSLYIRGWWL